MSTMLMSYDFWNLFMEPDGADHAERACPACMNYAAYRKHGWANCWWLYPSKEITEAQLERLLRESQLVIGGLFYRLQTQAQELVLRLAQKYPEKMIVMPVGEFDNHIHWNAMPDYFRTRAEAAKFFIDYFFNYKIIVGERTRSLREARYQALGGKTLEEAWLKEEPQKRIRFGNHVDGIAGIHLFYELGCDLLMIESSSPGINVQLSAAFLRGGAKQYKKKWGLHFSPWTGGVHREGRGPTAYDENGRHRAGNTAELAERLWVTSYLSGADICHQEAAKDTHWKFKAPIPFGPSNALVKAKDCTGELSPTGVKATAFAEFCLKRHPERGEPYVPVAVRLDHSPGWNAGGRWVQPRQIWGGKIPYGMGDFMIEGVFNHFVPDFRSCGRGWWKSWNQEVKWKSEHEYLEKIYAGAIDAREYEKGLFVPTPYGDCLDVITDRASLETLRQYELVIIAGDLNVKGALRERLAEYARGGGTLFVNFRHIKPCHEGAEALQGLEEFAGVRVISEYIPTYHPGQCHLCGAVTDEGAGESALVDPVDAEVLISGQTGDVLSAAMRKTTPDRTVPDPLITRHRLGKGNVIMSMPYYGLCPENHRLAACVQHTLDHLVRPLLPVEIFGAAIQHHFLKMPDDGWLLGLVNGTSAQWSGAIAMNACRGLNIQATDSWTDTDMATWMENTVPRFQAQVAPYSFKIINIAPKQKA